MKPWSSGEFHGENLMVGFHRSDHRLMWTRCHSRDAELLSWSQISALVGLGRRGSAWSLFCWRHKVIGGCWCKCVCFVLLMCDRENKDASQREICLWVPFCFLGLIPQQNSLHCRTDAHKISNSGGFSGESPPKTVSCPPKCPQSKIVLIVASRKAEPTGWVVCFGQQRALLTTAA